MLVKDVGYIIGNAQDHLRKSATTLRPFRALAWPYDQSDTLADFYEFMEQ